MAKVTIPTPQLEDANLALAVAELRDRMSAGPELTDAQVCRKYLRAHFRDLAMTRNRKVAEAALVIPALADDGAE